MEGEKVSDHSVWRGIGKFWNGLGAALVIVAFFGGVTHCGKQLHQQTIITGCIDACGDPLQADCAAVCMQPYNSSPAAAKAP